MYWLPVLDRSWWWVWSGCPGIGFTRMRQLADLSCELACGLGDLWDWPLSRFHEALGWPDSLLDSLAHYRQSWRSPGSASVPDHVLLPMDALWPASLSDLDRPPLSLQWCGRRDLWPLLSRRQAVAVIGTRRPSVHGVRMAEALGRSLASAGWPVVSGLAEGIDAAVHRACVQAKGVPVGVLGTPLHRVYPQEHRGLQMSVAETGLLFTELRDDARVQRSTFALRNRLLVAVARAVVIVECPKSSGALHSAAIAQSMGLPLWVVPGDAMRHSAQGSNALLQRQASALVDLSAFIHALGSGPVPSPDSVGRPMPRTPSTVKLLQQVDNGATLEQMARSLQDDPQHIAQQLMQLELDGVVTPMPGLRWRSL